MEAVTAKTPIGPECIGASAEKDGPSSDRAIAVAVDDDDDYVDEEMRLVYEESLGMKKKRKKALQYYFDRYQGLPHMLDNDDSESDEEDDFSDEDDNGKVPRFGPGGKRGPRQRRELSRRYPEDESTRQSSSSSKVAAFAANVPQKAQKKKLCVESSAKSSQSESESKSEEQARQNKKAQPPIPAGMTELERYRVVEEVLHLARNGQTAQVHESLTASPWLLNQSGEHGWTLLHCAARSGFLTLVEDLVKLGADVNAKSSASCDALLMACRMGFVEIVEHLLENGADPNSRSTDWSALGTAAYYDFMDICLVLLKKGADLMVVMLGNRNSLQWFGVGNWEHGPDHPTFPRLTKDDKEGRCTVLREAFANGPLVLKRRRDANWARRGAFILTMASNCFQPLAYRKALILAAKPPLPPNVRIPPLPAKTREERHAIYLGKIFGIEAGFEGIFKLIVAFL